MSTGFLLWSPGFRPCRAGEGAEALAAAMAENGALELLDLACNEVPFPRVWGPSHSGGGAVLTNHVSVISVSEEYSEEEIGSEI